MEGDGGVTTTTAGSVAPTASTTPAGFRYNWLNPLFLFG
jgi:hypothetical protein